MKPQPDAWEQFLKTGAVGDYINYCQSLATAPQDYEIIEGEEYPDADEYPSGGNKHSGY